MTSEGYRIASDGVYRWLFYSGEWCGEYEKRLARGDLDGVAGASFAPDGLAYLRRFPKLRFVSVVVERAADLAPIAELEALECLSVGIRRPSTRVVDFPVFPSLRSLATEGSTSLALLLANPTVRHLHMSYSPGDDVEFVSSMKELEKLCIASSGRTTSLRGIEQAEHLQALELSYLPRLESLKGVECLGELQRLDVESCRGVGDLEVVGESRALTLLGIKNCGEVASLQPLRSLQGLQSFLAWESTRIVDGDLSPLLELPQLRFVALKPRREYRPSVAEVKAVIEAREG